MIDELQEVYLASDYANKRFQLTEDSVQRLIQYGLDLQFEDELRQQEGNNG